MFDVDVTPDCPARDRIRLDRLLLAGSLCAWLGITLPTLAIADWRVQVSPAWWACMVVAAIPVTMAFTGSAYRHRAESRRRTRAPGVVLALLAAVTIWIAPLFTLTGVLGVLATVVIAHGFSLRTSLFITAAQILWYQLAVTMGEGDLARGTAWALVMAALHLFALVMISTAKGEAGARAQLAEAQQYVASASAAQERLRISRDLHDQLGHQLTALALNLEAAAHLTSGTAASEPIEACRDLARQTLADVRRVVGKLRDDAHVGADDLEQRLAHMAHTLAPGPNGPVITVHTRDIDDLTGVKNTTVGMACQEIATNAVRHSRADRLLLDVRSENGEIIIRALDDGLGAPPGWSEGNGLRGMRERFEALGGTLVAQNAPEGGFRVTARFPEDIS